MFPVLTTLDLSKFIIHCYTYTPVNSMEVSTTALFNRGSIFLGLVEFLFLLRVCLVRCFSKAGSVPVCVSGKKFLAVG